MVALLVLGTIVACLLVDGIIISLRERRVAEAKSLSPSVAQSLVFAQDGGEKIENEKCENPEEVAWEGLQSKLSSNQDSDKTKK